MRKGCSLLKKLPRKVWKSELVCYPYERFLLFFFFLRAKDAHCAPLTHVRHWVFFSTGKHKINHFSLNSLNRQALTGIDQCSDGGMWMSHVFSIIYTALLFLSPPLRQVSIRLHRNQSVICQTLSIRRLIYVSYCGWLHASVTAGKEQMGREGFCKRHRVLGEINCPRVEIYILDAATIRGLTYSVQYNKKKNWRREKYVLVSGKKNRGQQSL